MLLPAAERAFVDLRKLAESSLSIEHPVGGHKALMFERVLGITSDDALFLRNILIFLAPRAEAVLGRVDEFGQRYMIDFTLAPATGVATIRSGWIVRFDEDILASPRVTCFAFEAPLYARPPSDPASGYRSTHR